MSEITEERVKASILEFLMKKGRWGAHYFPIDTLVNFLSRKIKRNGKRVRKCVGDLVDKGYVLLHKKGKTISLNSAKSREIIEFIERVS
ncbi:MAG: hypothetical protein H3Z53_07180 [archaeon]|nr:hypothetical protein [archaeon]MCP8314136.1 hypothetical protein [archaeon]MCP8320956.1 hypothetical protein [archaeon]